MVIAKLNFITQTPWAVEAHAAIGMNLGHRTYLFAPNGFAIKWEIQQLIERQVVPISKVVLVNIDCFTLSQAIQARPFGMSHLMRHADRVPLGIRVGPHL